MSAREDRLYYTGDGTYYLPGVPARDLEEADIAALTDPLYADAIAPNPATGKALYQKTNPAGRDAEKPKRKRTASTRTATAKRAPAPATEPPLEPEAEPAPEATPAEAATTE